MCGIYKTMQTGRKLSIFVEELSVFVKIIELATY